MWSGIGARFSMILRAIRFSEKVSDISNQAGITYGFQERMDSPCNHSDSRLLHNRTYCGRIYSAANFLSIFSEGQATELLERSVVNTR